MQYVEVVAALRAAGCVYAEEEAGLLRDDGRDPATLVARRAQGEPLEHVLGWAEFCGLRLQVAPGVFVPRRRTELLAREAVARLPQEGVAVELCCGVAPVAAVVLARCAGVEVYAADLDPVAVAVAGRNLPADRVLTGDLFDALPRHLHGRIDVLAANTPYVPSAEVHRLPAEARDHEPRAALDGGPDGLAVLRRIARASAEWLAPDGHVLIEVSDRQLPTAVTELSAAGLTPGSVHDDEAGATVVTGQLRAERRS